MQLKNRVDLKEDVKANSLHDAFKLELENSYTND